MEILNTNYKEQFEITTKSVKDHFNLLLEKWKKTVRSNDAKSGINVDEKEIDIILDNIISDISDCTQKLSEQTADKQTAEDLEKEKAEDVRKKQWKV